ncbi:MAG: bifunctional adenosylcobinamide kinase/adenosylcobinamide-phosphate guanylyltransferase [Lachnospiraceae bacterium]|nr:bifunctional adenosylcobinamide kinase/adenosylcobinamide-phosphate guanylyltransferase [Lachnospiraceae bacterium]
MLIVVTGGSGSGKSEYAESLVLRLAKGPKLYIATMYPFDEESHQRIARHRRMRKGKGFDTLELYTGLKNADISGYDTALLECMSNLCANEMYQENGAGARSAEEILDGVRQIYGQCRHLIIVTNEIFSDGIDYDPETVRYQRCLGEINRRLAKMADLVVEVVYSIPLIHKGSLPEISTAGLTEAFALPGHKGE